jgi:NADPH2:quinone reductase
MHAIRQHEFGPAETLRYEQVDDPIPTPGQVRIAVAAAGIHLIDTRIRTGAPGPFPPPNLPMTPGREVAGVVDTLGDGVNKRWLGQRVVAHLGQASGGYAELAIAPAENLHALPDTLTDEAAVAMIGTGRSTMSILDAAGLTAADVVLVTAAAGGIGSLLVQEARNLGATSVGLAGGAAKVERVRALGATLAVDYSEAGWAEAVRKEFDVTVALDGVGGELGRGALELVAPGGRLLMFGWASGEPIPLTAMDFFARGLTVGAAIGPGRAGGASLRELEIRALEAAATGRLTPQIGPVFPLARAAAAHAALESRGTTGKVLLKP